MASLGKAADGACIGGAKESLLQELQGEFMVGRVWASPSEVADLRDGHRRRFHAFPRLDRMRPSSINPGG